MKTNMLTLNAKAAAAFFAICLLSVIAYPTFAHAENGGRGGGSAIVCSQLPGQPPMMILDYYEAALTTNLTIDLGPDTGTYQDRVNYVLDRLSKVDSLAADKYRSQMMTFEKESGFVSKDQLAAVADSNELVTPIPGCIKAQFAVQKFNLRPNEYRYIINKDLWNAAGAKVRAGLVLHELIYRDTVENANATNSDNARYLNAQISSTRMATISATDYMSLLQTAGLSQRKFVVFLDGLPMLNDSADPLSISNPVLNSDTPVPYFHAGKVWKISAQSHLTFDEDGKLKFASVDTEETFEGITLPLQNVDANFSDPQSVQLAPPIIYEGQATALALYPDSAGTYPTVTVGSVTMSRVRFVSIGFSSEKGYFIDQLEGRQDSETRIGSQKITGGARVHLHDRSDSGSGTHITAFANGLGKNTFDLNGHPFTADACSFNLSFTTEIIPTISQVSNLKCGAASAHFSLGALDLTPSQVNLVSCRGNQVCYDVQLGQGQLFKSGNSSFYFSGYSSHSFLRLDDQGKVVGIFGPSAFTYNFQIQGKTILANAVSFFENGEISCVTLTSVYSDAGIPFTTKLATYAAPGGNEVCFFKDSQLKTVFAPKLQPVPVGAKIILVAGRIVFYPSGLTAYADSADLSTATLGTNCEIVGLSSINSQTNVVGYVFSEAGVACASDHALTNDLIDAILPKMDQIVR